jgi:hypothetical protein
MCDGKEENGTNPTRLFSQRGSLFRAKDHTTTHNHTFDVLERRTYE